MSNEELDELSTRERTFGTAQTFQVPPVEENRRIPHADNQVIDDMDDERASLVFRAKNVLVWNPIYILSKSKSTG